MSPLYSFLPRRCSDTSLTFTSFSTRKNFNFVYKNVRYHNFFGRKSVTLRVNNTGLYNGTEVVRMFVSRPEDKEGPLKTLRAFKRVDVRAGKSVKVRIRIDDDTFIWWGE